MLMMLVSACTLISACAAVLYVFFSFFIENTQEDIEYVLNSTSQQFQSHMQFIEDGAVSIRHNMMLNDFFDTGKSGADYDRTVTEPQLSYSMELFSDRNMINKKIPFVTSVYLFNNAGDCIYEHYYASTLAAEKKEETQYLSMQRQFQQSQDRYACVSDDKSINLLFRIYDDHMEEKGICIAKISREAVNVLLGEGIAYSDCTWMVLFGDDRIIAFQGRWSEIEQLTQLERVWRGKRLLKEHNVIGCAKMCGFDIRTVICVGEENIFSVLKSTVLIFVVGLIIVLIVTVLVAFGLSYRFTRPVTRMIEKIQAFGKQDFDDRMEDSTIQEYHDIGVVFNEMAERIKYLIMQVYEKQLLATQYQVKYLQAQTNPHFQFNILSMLSLKAKMAGNEEVYEGLKAFSKLMQGKIFREKEIKIKVSEELEIVRFYLYLQKSRYQDKICYEIKVQDDRINQNLIPRLLIEPLVENAVSHGLEPKRGNGIIKIILYEEPGIYDGSMMLHICVEDDGVGFDPEKMVENGGEKELLDGKIEHTHTGLENTKRMLTILYGSFHEFRISGGIGRGTKVEIVIPSERGGYDVESHSS